MARRVFFSFHYERDVQRASIVRNHWVTKDGAEDAGYVDKASWEKIERGGRQAIKDWVDGQLKGTSVTAILIGPETSNREWVKYELQKSYERKNGLLELTGTSQRHYAMIQLYLRVSSAYRAPSKLCSPRGELSPPATTRRNPIVRRSLLP